LPGSIVFPQTSFTVGANPSALVANNFTGGTLPDLAVVFDDPKANTFVILQDQDNGNFVQVTPSPITLGANETGQVAIGTGVFRNDLTKFPTTQPPDVVLVNSTSNNVSVLLGNVDANGKANGLFTEAPGSPFAVGNNPRSVVVADFNGDGFLDFAIANQGDNSISLFRGHGDGTFTEATGSPQPKSPNPAAIVIANFANGTVPDIAVTNKGSATLGVYLGQGQGTFASRIELNTPTGPTALIASALTTSGLPDVALVSQDSAATNGVVTIIQDSTNFANSSTVGVAQTPYPA